MVAFAVIVFLPMSYMFALHHEMSFFASGGSVIPALSDEIVLIVSSIMNTSYDDFFKDHGPHLNLIFSDSINPCYDNSIFRNRLGSSYIIF